MAGIQVDAGRTQGRAAASPPSRTGVFVLTLAGMAALLLWLYAPSFGNGFADDDFALLRQAQSRGVGEILADDFGTRSAPFWRPGWRLLFRAGYLCLGDQELPWFAFCIGMHVLLALVVVALLRRRLGLPAATLAGLLYGVGAAHVEAVLWPAAALNALPAALFLLLSGWSLLRWAEGGGLGWTVAALAGFVASMLFREAAYHLPLLVLAAWACLTDAAGRRRPVRELLAVFVPMALMVVAHYVWLNRKSATRLSLGESLEQLVVCAGTYAGALLGWPGSGILALAVLVGGVGLLVVAGDRRTRVTALWVLAALWPYALMDYASRLATFAALALAVALGHAAAATQPRPWLRWLAFGLGGLLLATHGLRHRGEQALLRDRGEVCRAILRSCRELKLHEQPFLVVDRVPTELHNSLREMLELRLGSAPPVVEMLLLPRPPLALYVGVSPDGVPPDAAVVHYEPSPEPRQHRFVLLPRAALAPGLVPVPPFAITESYQEFADAAAAGQAIAAGALDPRRTTAVVGPLPKPLPPEPQRGRVLGFRLEDRVVTAEVEAETAVLLAICHYVDLTMAPATVAIDGTNVPILQANGVANAVLVPPGRHQVVVKWLVR